MFYSILSIFYDTLSKWINASGKRIYKDDWKEKGDVEIFKFLELIILIVYVNRK